MRVELKPHIARDVKTKQEVIVPQYMVMIDGKLSGYMSFQPGSKVMLLGHRYGPMELKEINKQIAGMLEVPEVQSVTAPDIDELPEPELTASDDYDDTH